MWLDRIIKVLLPREEHFFDLLESGSDIARRCSELLVECCEVSNYAAREAAIARMQELEHESDHVIHEMYERLNRTFVTPLDRSDIYALATELEDIVDAIHATASHVVVHAMEDLPEGSIELASHIRDACLEVHGAVGMLRGLKNLEGIRARCKRVTALESSGDRVFRTRIGEMFKHEKDAIRLLKHKEFLEGLERTLDVCNSVANTLETIVIKNG